MQMRRVHEDEGADMSFSHIFDVAAAVIVSLGGGAALVWGLSTVLGNVWAARILEQDRLKYGAQL
jgi:hypothetical protein